MWKLLIAGTAASVIAGSTLLFAQQPPVPAATVLTGEERDQDNGWQSSAEDGRDNGGRPSAEDDQDNGWQPSDEVSQDEDNQQNGWQRSSEDNQEHNAWQPSAEDTSAFMDARIAALKAGLRLTADQEKNWPAFETAVRDMAKVRADRWAMRQNEQPPADPVEWLQRRADALGKAAAGLKKLADAEGPLYKSLDDAQKHRFEVLAQGLGPHRHGWNCRWRHHQ